MGEWLQYADIVERGSGCNMQTLSWKGEWLQYAVIELEGGSGCNMQSLSWKGEWLQYADIEWLQICRH